MTIRINDFMIELAHGNLFIRLPGVGQALVALTARYDADRRFIWDSWASARGDFGGQAVL